MNTLIKKNNIATSHVPVEKLNRLSKNSNHQGVAAQISPIEFADLDTLITETLEKKKNPIFLLLDQISDVRQGSKSQLNSLFLNTKIFRLTRARRPETRK